MPTVGFDPTIAAGERPQTYALDLAATGTGLQWFSWVYFTGLMSVATFINSLIKDACC